MIILSNALGLFIGNWFIHGILFGSLKKGFVIGLISALIYIPAMYLFLVGIDVFL